MKGANIVVYAVANGVRQPIGSIAPDDKNASVRVQHFASQSFRDADARGTSHPEIVTVLEMREADESERISGRFIELNIATLTPLMEGDRGVTELAQIFAPKEK